MSKLLISKAGEINTRAGWEEWTNKFWEKLHTDQLDAANFPKPTDAWDRVVRLLGLKEVDGDEKEEDGGNNGSYRGVF